MCIRDSNKGTAFTEDERVALGLDGLLPPQVNTLEQQVERVYRGFLREPDPIAKYQYLRALQERAETLFYALLEPVSYTHLDVYKRQVMASTTSKPM